MKNRRLNYEQVETVLCAANLGLGDLIEELIKYGAENDTDGKMIPSVAKLIELLQSIVSLEESLKRDRTGEPIADEESWDEIPLISDLEKSKFQVIQ